MAISLPDAIERAKLVRDNDGHVSQYFYNQLLNSLDMTDQHAFAMALVDNGVQVKTGTEQTRMPVEAELEEHESESGELDGEGIYNLFARVAQTFAQSPGGVWMPSEHSKPKEDIEDVEPEDYEEYGIEQEPGIDPSELMHNVEDYGDDEEEDAGDYLTQKPKWVTEEQSQKQLSDDGSGKEFLDVENMEYVQGALERNGITVDENGIVSFYKSSVPGVYTDKTTTKPMPLNKAVGYYQGLVNTYDSEQKKVHELQDILVRFKNDSEALSNFRYSVQSRNPVISEIGKGVSELRDRMEGVDEFANNLVKTLEGYFETQYNRYDSYLEVYEALSTLAQWKKSDPQKYRVVIEGIGAV